MKLSSPPIPKPPQSHAATTWPHFLFGLLVFALMGPSIFGSAVPAFRDTLHFYFPLWYFLDQQSLLESLIPTWNPLDACGSSILAEPTSAVFYPLRFLFFLPQLDLSQRIGIFLGAHLLIAYFQAYWAAKEFGRIRFAAIATAYTYALSGPIFFQIYNPVFLVGAAWLPMAWRYAWRIRNRHPSGHQNICGLAVALAMMVLGGDAQLAFHTVLIGVCMLLVSSVWQPWKILLPIAWRWILGAILAVGLSAIQIVPTLYWWSVSDRVGSHDKLYHFSVAPWHLVTLLFPNGLGSYTPENTRWISMFPAEGLMWVPSMHIGVLGLVGVLAYFSFYPRRIRNAETAMILSVAVIALLSSFGGYGLGWVIRSFYMSVGEVNESIGIPDEWGSLQWLWVETIPGYSSFRFPAKWLTLFSWACCLLAGNGLSQLLERPHAPAWFRRLTILTICVSIAIAILLSIPTFRDSLFARWQQIPSDPLCGPVSPEAARSAILLSLGHGMMAMILTLSLFLFRNISARLPWAIVLIGLDLFVAAWQQTSFVKEANLHAYARETLPSNLGQSDDSVQSQVKHRFAKLHLLTEVRNWDASLTINPKALSVWRATSSQQGVDVSSFKLDAGMHGPWKQSWNPERWSPKASQSDSTIDPSEINARWLALGSLQVDYDCREPTTILLPLFQDGGWSAVLSSPSTISDYASESRQLEIADLDGLRTTLKLPAGKGVAIVRYQPPGLVLGAILSMLATALLVTQKMKKR